MIRSGCTLNEWRSLKTLIWLYYRLQHTSDHRQYQGWSRPYSIIIINMRFIPKASLRASSQITASLYILERHLWVKNWKPFALTPTWSLTVLLLVCGNCLTVNTKHLYDFMQCWTSVEDVGPTLYKCHTNVLCLLGRKTFFKHCTFIQCWFNVGPASQTLA